MWQHDSAQWAKELMAYFATYQGGKRVFLLAIGGLDEHQLRDIPSLKRLLEHYPIASNTFTLLAQSWAGLWQILTLVQDTLSANEQRIIADIRHILILHAIRVTAPGWLKELPQDIQALQPNIAAAMPFFAGAKAPAPKANWLEDMRAIGPLSNAAFLIFQR